MNTSFYTAVSGIKTQQFGIDVWGNNISNINTVGYRSYTPEFETLFSGLKNMVATQGMDELGLGATAQTTSMSTKDGNYQNTENNFDLAISGKGWFGVKKAGDENMYFTRAGAFTTDANGYLVNPSGDKLMGTYAPGFDENTGVVSTAAIKGSTLLNDPTKQTSLRFTKDLTHPGVAAKDAVTKTAPEHFMTKSGSSAEVGYVLPKATTSVVEIVDASGQTVKTFKNTQTQTSGDHTITWDGKADDGTTAPDGVYTVKTTYVDKAAVPAVPKGNLKQYQVDSNGMVIAGFDNGQSVIVGQIPVFHFQNEQGLQKIGDTEFATTDNSGKAIFYKDKNGDVIQGAKVIEKTLETSNVSTAEALTQLIITQKAYDANAKCVTTSDQMIQRALALKNR